MLLIGNMPDTTPEPLAADDYASCYDAATGKFLWAITAANNPERSFIPSLPITAVGDGFLIGGVYPLKNKVVKRTYLIDGRDGSLGWQRSICGDDPYFIDENIIYFSGIEAYRLSDGVKLWDARSAEDFKRFTSQRFMRDHIVFNQSLFSDANVTLNAVSAVRRDSGSTDWSHFQLTEHRNQLSSVSSAGTPQSLTDIVCHRWGISLLGWKSEMTTTSVQLANGRIRSSIANVQSLTIRTSLTNPDALREDLSRFAATLTERDSLILRNAVGSSVRALENGQYADASIALSTLLESRPEALSAAVYDRLIGHFDRLRRRARATTRSDKI